jgi:hypothetical protein
MRAGIPTFREFVKPTYRVNKHKEIAAILDYLSHVELPRSAIAKLHEDMGIPESRPRDWHERRTQPGNTDWFPLFEGIHLPESLIPTRNVDY